MYKLKFLILITNLMSKVLGNIYDRSIAIVFRNVFFGTFMRSWKCDTWQKELKHCQNLYYPFIQKNSRTGHRKTCIT